MGHDVHSFQGIEVVVETGLEVDQGGDAPELAPYKNERPATTQRFGITRFLPKSKIQRSKKSRKLLITWIALGFIIFFAVGITIGAIVVPMTTKKKQSYHSRMTPGVKPSLSVTTLVLASLTSQSSPMPESITSTLATTTRTPTVTPFPTISQESTTTTTATVSIDPNQNLNIFTGNLGADPLKITPSNATDHPYLVAGEELAGFRDAINKACDGQFNSCAAAATNELERQSQVADCDNQKGA
ncbi:hypothetical protein F5Y18DRAFT_433148 [Xylariaceae sp. FL1019]|nr:hypothetical protein F5Y18DRAFT_433148 [Xylariaceae sp. FL1019]